jgi:hypothetical protein
MSGLEVRFHGGSPPGPVRGCADGADRGQWSLRGCEKTSGGNAPMARAPFLHSIAGTSRSPRLPAHDPRLVAFLVAALPRGVSGASVPGPVGEPVSRADLVPGLPIVADTPVVAATRGPVPAAQRLFGGPGSPLGDLAVRFRARGEIRGRLGALPPLRRSLQVTCSPGLVPRLQPDMQFSLEAAGTVGDRLALDVDYDQTREFGGANRFQVYWQGEGRGRLRRVELGDVTFALPDSRFLTRGIPAGELRAPGPRRPGRGGPGRGGAAAGVPPDPGVPAPGATDPGSLREDTLVVEDAQYVQGQFFFLVEPALLPGHPTSEVLNLRPGDVRA